MKPVDDSPGARIRTAEEFYDNIAPQYDAMSGFERRFEKERPVFRALVERYRIKRALDAELYFYSRIFRFTPAEPIEPVKIENLAGS